MPPCINSSTQRKGPHFFSSKCSKLCLLLNCAIPEGVTFVIIQPRWGTSFLICTKSPYRLAGSWKCYCYLPPLPEFPAADAVFLSSVSIPVWRMSWFLSESSLVNWALQKGMSHPKDCLPCAGNQTQCSLWRTIWVSESDLSSLRDITL